MKKGKQKRQVINVEKAMKGITTYNKFLDTFVVKAYRKQGYPKGVYPKSVQDFIEYPIDIDILRRVFNKTSAKFYDWDYTRCQKEWNHFMKTIGWDKSVDNFNTKRWYLDSIPQAMAVIVFQSIGVSKIY